MRANSDEYRILRFLKEQNLETLQENCVIPVLDLLPANGFWLAVMPRFGDAFYPTCKFLNSSFKVGPLSDFPKLPICARDSSHYAIYAQGEAFAGYLISVRLNQCRA